MKQYILLVLISLSWTIINGQDNTIKGKVGTEENPLSFANVALLNSNYGITADENGAFELKGIPAGKYVLAVSVLGYKRWRKEVQLEKGIVLDLGRIDLQEDVLGLEEVVVTGTMKETFVTASPIKVEVITARYLEKNIAPTNLVEGISLVNGVQEVVACGVCFTNSISINGLEGAYTAILMDGAPIYGNLAAVYGLNGIPTTIIDRFEVVKGPSSTLYGSEAVAGVINIITKDPETQPLLSLDIMGTSHLESFGSIALAPKLGKWNGYIGLNYAYINDFDDRNEDGFGDGISMDRWSFFSKWAMKRKSGKKFTLAGKYYYEDRRNGVEAFLKDRAYRELRGDDQVYGESIYTKRGELFGTYELPTTTSLKVNYSLSYHYQDSYYGTDFYEAKQGIAFTNFLWNTIKGKHDILVGGTLRYQFYDDNTVATEQLLNDQLENRPDEQFVPGIFIQDEWQVTKKLTLLTGVRLDHFRKHGLIASPRFNVKYNLSDWTTLRTNFGTGFRIVNLFTEDHAFVTGQRTVEILESLEPEQSYNTSLNINHIYLLGDGQGSIDIDAYYTYFTNKIIPDYDTPGKIIYTNSTGHAISKGLGLSVNHQFSFPLAFNLGLNYQKVTRTEPNADGIMETSDVEFAQEWSGIATVNYDWKAKGVNFAYTLRLTGPMALPEVFDLDENGDPLANPRPTRSEAYAFHNIQITKSLKKYNMDIYGGIQNIFNFIQATSPLVGFNDPNTAPGFSSSFDTSYAYAPIHGREIYLGIKWRLKG